MSSVSNVTSQLNNIGGCNSDNCCDQIAALSARISSLESQVSQAQSTASQASGKASEAFQKGATAIGMVGALQITMGGLGGEIASVATVAAGARAAAAAAAGQAANALGQAGSALSGVAGAMSRIGTMALQIAGVAVAIALATQALNAANEAGQKAAYALEIALDAIKTAAAASGSVIDANLIATEAKSIGKAAYDLAKSAMKRAGEALENSVGAIETANEASNKADRAFSGITTLTASGALTQATASTAQATADRAIAAAAASAGSPGRVGAPGRDGTPGQAGAPGKDGAAGKNGAPGAAGTSADPSLSNRVKQLENTAGNNTVNSGKENEIIELIAKLSAAVLVMPTSIANSQTFRAAATSAAAAGACQSSKPGGCNGGSADQISKLEGLMSGLSSAYGALNNALLNTMNSTLNIVNSKLGNQITGGLSKWTTNLAEIANRSQILNIFTWVGVMHNAYFLSNSLTQSLFSAISNSMAALGIKDTSTDPAGTPFNVGQLVSTWTDSYFKSIFGVAQVEGMKAEWKKYSRIYQAAAQVMYSIQSIGQSMLGALEVVGSHVAKIGNAMQKFRLVGEKAYSWMNPQPGFQNRFFTVLQGTQEVVSQIDQVASTVLSTQESITQMSKNKDDLVKSMSEDPNGKKGEAVPEAAQVKAAADASKTASKSPDIPASAQVKP
jgi:Collagen triple helix repeat (20 copies)